jgi:putative copper resistance protein D
LIDPVLATVRSVHFAATLLLEGMVVFRFAVLQPGIQAAESLAGVMQRPFLRSATILAWLTAVLSGAAWLLVLSGEIAGTSPFEALRQGIDWTVLTRTQFGEVWQLRGLMALVGILCLAAVDRAKPGANWIGILLLVSTLAFSGSLAWSGHGAATVGAIGHLHLASDILHLIVAGMWVGGLLPFALVLHRLMRDPTSAIATSIVTRRFSSLALVSVAVLIATGIVNTWVLVGDVSALAGTLYGWLLSAKIGLFLLMLGFAAVNRIYLMPRLASNRNAKQSAVRRLVVHSACEVVLGLAVIAIVGVLGTLPPPAH